MHGVAGHLPGLHWRVGAPGPTRCGAASFRDGPTGHLGLPCGPLRPEAPPSRHASAEAGRAVHAEVPCMGVARGTPPLDGKGSNYVLSPS
ncbi:hypothetical protein IscW_ISCW016494 [Ixodes scapularis]|uniref:Uncharacterized protein n=1 Tax=Ixodes scapularis TaxID=6945 RepID=B7P2C5_IXOSC|nr:hypothetical protein IscW_ISCW016494 [Ixodes scapularis]|eukprot:XP_002402052.1 hypothetical protein IscW_ISCW016494 [Ixodes scapularis]